MSDGSSVLRILDPDTLKATGSIMVTADGVPVTNRIACIDPATGHVLGWIDPSRVSAQSSPG